MQLSDQHLRRAQSLISSDQRDEAIRVLAKVLIEDPSAVEAWYLLGLAVEDHEKKIYAFERALKLDQYHAGAMEQLNPLRGKKEEAPEDIQLRKARMLLEDGHRNAAKKVTVDYLRQNPESEGGWYLLGSILVNPAQKAQAFKRALKLNPSHIAARRELRSLRKTHGLALPPGEQIPLAKQTKPRGAFRDLLGFTKYTLTRVATIGITIIAGIFLTISIANSTGQIDQNVARHVEREARNRSYEVGSATSDERRIFYENTLAEMRSEAGLDLPTFPRTVRWTANALTFNWGEFLLLHLTSLNPNKPHYQNVRSVILERLPNSLMLVGTADLLIFLIGIPLALRLAGKEESRLNRLLNFLAPLSSIPSWVFGILLVSIFAIQLRLLPIEGMLDMFPPTTKIGYVPIVLKHMILPVAAIVLSLIFQLTYSWRTYFSIFSREDYVELAKAKGLKAKIVERKYIFRPSVPFVITSFALTLVSFWQLTTALEVVFKWPGIGRLYIDSLPNYWGPSYFPGEMAVSVAIVALFAYLLGFIVLALDIAYAIVDPRVRVWNASPTLSRLKAKGRRRSARQPHRMRRPAATRSRAITDPVKNTKLFWSELWVTAKLRWGSARAFLREFARYPSAMIGLAILTLLICGSVYAVIALPYNEVGITWYQEAVRGEIYRPRLGKPTWTNWFHEEKLLSTIVLKSEDGTAGKEYIEEAGSLGPEVKLTFQFEYPYSEVPEEMFFYFDPDYAEKRPFMSVTWITPDGRELALKGFSSEARKRIDLAEYIPRSAKLESAQEEIAAVGVEEDLGSPDLIPFFIEPESGSKSPMKGRYTVLIEGFLFEEGADLEGELVILGQVYGIAGTDYYRRELIVPLLWGMPFALGFGLLGALLTILLALTIAAIGVWYGGWIDSLIQRVTEANMIIPILAIGILLYSIFNVELWIILVVILFMNIFSVPTKAFRAGFLQIREAPYIEAAQSYGATDFRIIFRYMVPRIVPTLIPQLIALIPSYVFLEATLGFFNVNSIYPTWGKIIYEAIHHGANYGSHFWVIEPLALLLLTGLAFGMLGYALERILNPKIQTA